MPAPTKPRVCKCPPPGLTYNRGVPLRHNVNDQVFSPHNRPVPLILGRIGSVVYKVVNEGRRRENRSWMGLWGGGEERGGGGERERLTFVGSRTKYIQNINITITVDINISEIGGKN